MKYTRLPQFFAEQINVKYLSVSLLIQSVFSEQRDPASEPVCPASGENQSNDEFPSSELVQI